MERVGPFGVSQHYWITARVQSLDDRDSAGDEQEQTTRAEDHPLPDAEEDHYDDRYAWMMGKRVYLGSDTQINRLFWLLVKPLGRVRSLAEVQVAVDGMQTNAALGHTESDIELAGQRIRKAISKLRTRMREAQLEDHFVIHRGGDSDDAEYSMIRRYPNQK